MKKLNNKGFTLIEIVIVIVIIAILAAMLVPSLTSWIDNSKQKSFVEGANSIKTATLSTLSTKYAEENEFTISTSDAAAVQKLAGDGIEIKDIAFKTDAINVKTGVKTKETAKSKEYKVYVQYTAATKSVDAVTVWNDTYYSTYTASTNSWKTAKIADIAS